MNKPNETSYTNREKKMKRITLITLLLSLGIVFLLPSLAPAQGGPGGRSPEAMLKRLQDSLALSAEQLTKVKVILKKTSEEMDKLRADLQDDREALMLAVRESREKQNVQIDSVLTPEQRIKFKKINDEMRSQRMRQGGGGMRGN
jgi:Spy/CpxP family protein refolding chaperone